MTLVEDMSRDAPDGAQPIVARNLVGALIGGLLIATVEFAATRASVQYSVTEQLAWLARLSVHWSLAALPLGVALGLAEIRAHGGAPSRLAYSTAVVLGAIAGGIVMALHGKFVDPAISETAVGLDLALPDRFLYGFWQLGFWGTVGAVWHATDHRHRRSVVALRKEEIARLRSERRLSDARLAALHAQVEPQFLLATLHRVEELYAKDAAAADRVLDALIQFLREATPLLRQQDSNVSQECRLLQIYLRVLGAESSRASSLVTDIEPETAGISLPPGILVSLAQRMLDAAPGGEPRLEVRSSRRDDTLNLDLSAIADGVACTQALGDFTERTEQRLILSHGPGSSIVVMQDGPGSLTLRIALIDHRGTDHAGSHGH